MDGRLPVVIDSQINPACVYRPGTFSGLMTLYESNYVKLRQLYGISTWVAGASQRSVCARDNDLHADVLRREPYTTTLRMTYWFDDATGLVADPDLVLRVYHDARVVEAVSCGDVHRHPKLRELSCDRHAELDRRWRLNMMLNKWFDYLFDVGHSFGARVHRNG